MSIIRRLDAWLGKTLFHPPIILVCQLTRQTQYAIHRALWFVIGLICFARAPSLTAQIFVGLFCLCMMVSAALFADDHKDGFGFLRAFWWFGLAWDLMWLAVIACVLGRLSQIYLGSVGLDVLILFAEYALTIRNIPPRKKRERRTSAKAVRA